MGMEDERPLRLRILDALGVDTWKAPIDVATITGDAYYNVSAMMSKMFLYGGPLDRVRDPNNTRRFLYRRKTVAEVSAARAAKPTPTAHLSQ